MDQPRIASRRADFSPEKQALLQKRIRGEIPSKVSIAKIPRRQDRSAAPLSLAQEGQWLLEQLHPGNAVFSVNQILRIPDKLDREILEQSLAEVARRHDTLRTSFHTMGGPPMQVIRPPGPVSLEWVEATGLSDKESARWIKERTSRPFDLRDGDLFRVHVLCLDKNDHIVLLNLHHIICDGWSLGVLIGEIMGAYQAFTRGEPPSRPELALQYADYADWQRTVLQHDVIERQLSFWRAKLAGAPPFTPLPFDRPRPHQRSFRGSRRPIHLRSKLITRLRILCQQCQATLFMAFLATLATLVHRYSGVDNIVLGCPVANRKFPEIEPLIGLFINTMVFRIDLSGDPSFEELIVRVRAEAMEVYSNQDVPFETIVKELGIRREESHPPVFQVMLAMQPPRMASMFSRLDIEPASLAPDRSKFDLMLLLTELDDGEVSGNLEFPTDVFDAETIDRLIGHFFNLLEGAAVDPSRPLSALPMLSEVERGAAVMEGKDTAAQMRRDSCIHELVDEQTARSPDAVAIRQEGRNLTYVEVNRRANQLARHLRRLGVGPEVVVGLCMTRSAELVIALLAIFKAGGGYLPLDPTYPQDRLSYMLQDAGAEVIITEAALLDALPSQGGTVVRLDADWPEIARLPTSAPPSGAVPDNLAYLLYTSGSTGQPKGVMGTHKAVVNRLLWDVGPEASQEIYAQKTTPNFIDMLWEVFMPLIRGQPVAIVPENLVLEPGKLIDWLAREQATRIVLVPSLLRAILGRFTGNLPERVPELHHWAVSGEPLSEDLAGSFQQRLPHARLFNIYGTTEFWDATWFEVPHGTKLDSVLIGVPLTNMRAVVIDKRSEPLPINATAELFIGGTGLARGYLRRPGLTAERFVPDAFGSGERLYRTGDLARRLTNGVLAFGGRRDRQIKIRGRRIEPGEIEAVLASYPDIRQAVVIGRGEGGETMLVAYLVASESATVDLNAVRSHLRAHLPEYMVPAAFMVLPSMPLMPNGKVDRGALPAPSDATVANDYVPAETPAEEALAAIWQELLKRDRVGIDDNFFDLGGDSLMLVRMQGEIATRLQREVAVTQLFRFPTIRSLTAHLGEEGQDGVVERSSLRGEARRHARQQRTRAVPTEIPEDLDASPARK